MPRKMLRDLCGQFRKSIVDDNDRFEVTVWNHEGDIVRKEWEATYDEAEAIREEYADDPLLTVVVDERT